MDWFFVGFLNVRVFKVGDNPGEMLMDTLGLAAIGLPDLQCHFRDLDLNEVADLLSKKEFLKMAPLQVLYPMVESPKHKTYYLSYISRNKRLR